MGMRIRVITLSSADALLATCRGLFPDADVGVQRGIDVRRTNVESLIKARLLTHSAAHSLIHGRKRHNEIGSKGAIGIAQANRLAVEEEPRDEALLLLEDDCVLAHPARFAEAIATFLSRQDEFDVVVFGTFGPKGRQSRAGQKAWYPANFHDLIGPFWGMHCVLYSPTGRDKVASLLRHPVDMQIDSLYGSHALFADLRVIGEVAALRERLATQVAHGSFFPHRSSIQTDVGSGVLIRCNQNYRTVVGGLVVFVSLCVLTSRLVRESRASRRRTWA